MQLIKSTFILVMNIYYAKITPWLNLFFYFSIHQGTSDTTITTNRKRAVYGIWQNINFNAPNLKYHMRFRPF